MLKWFICPDKERIAVKDCLKEGGCRLGGNRCATRSYLGLVGADRPLIWSCPKCKHEFVESKNE